MEVRDLKREPSWGVIWSWRTAEDRPAAYRHDHKGPEVVVGVRGGKTDGLWHHTGPEFGAEPRVIVCRRGLPGRVHRDDAGRPTGWERDSDEDEANIRAYAESIELPGGLP
jgi:hypothetical protein